MPATPTKAKPASGCTSSERSAPGSALPGSTPPNNWGDQEGGYDLTGAKYLELWARGEYGIEKINIGVGLLGQDKAHPDSGKTTVENIQLSKEWKRYRIRLKRLDLSSIKTGFVLVLSGRRPDATVYLDSIRFVRK